MKTRKAKSGNLKTTARLILQLSLVGILLASVYFLLGPDDFSWKENIPPPGRPVENTVELQIALTRLGFSPGSIDGTPGTQTKQALAAFQKSRELDATGEINDDLATWLRIEEPTHAYIELSEEALSRLTPEPSSWRERGQLSHYGYHSILEMVAEKTSAAPDYIRAINPELDWSALRAGDRVLAPLVPPYRIDDTISRIRIGLGKRQLQAFDASGNIIFHCPVSIARDVAKRPVGELIVKVRVANPNYTFNPEILGTTAAREGISKKFIIQPGPNNPVGTVWLGLNRPSYGIHGTPSPEKVGRTESSGCFRLANWNAETLLHATEVGTPVHVLP
ncbi:murein L,D-transpeptidase [Coraliomargarita sinensis]|uniref:Murein L,D-transpeptidase n=1 Tax=Coraliomargarita sinensis TaxID=2174842 RepID=A0A317ZIN0_9BACT|nr:L,D-transpeptidase [Coraliomargarita sinensis]PXA04073.1 murein L,D-transpeptidase [Coraliomargarita sinensis]